MARLAVLAFCAIFRACVGMQLQHVPTPNDIMGHCQHLVETAHPDLATKDPVCDGEINETPGIRERGLAEPVRCVRDKLASVVAKVCQMCVFGFTAKASIDRTTGHCADRYKMVNHMVAQINRGDGVAELASLRQVALALGPSLKSHKNLDNAVAFYQPQFTATKAGKNLIDMDGNGEVDTNEMKAFMQVGFIFTDMVQEALLPDRSLSEHDLAFYTQDWHTQFIDWWNPAKL